MKRAKLIVIEGTDGSGKETQSKKLESYYLEKGLNVKRYSFPIYSSPTGRMVGGPYLGKSEYGETYNDVIILDRYITSNMGHQAGKAKTDKERDKILRFIEILEYDLCELPRPDKVVFLHMPFEAAKELRKDRAGGDGNENNEEHLRNAEKTYVYIAEKYGWDYINCLRTDKYRSLEDIKSIDEISEEVIKLCEEKMTLKNIQRMTRF